MADWIEVSSSNLDAVLYDSDTRVLSIRFKSGSEYSYADVPPEVAGELVRALSPGRFFRDNIRGAYDRV